MPRAIVRAPGHDRNRSLGWMAVAWMEHFVVHGPGDVQGEPVRHGDEYTGFVVDCYAVDDAGRLRSDHYLKMGSGDGLPGPTDAWITLAGLARETKRIRLGTLMTAGTFRLPGVLAIQVAQVDHMSGGRVELGLGTGWFEEEHKAYGIPFPKEKFGRLEEQLAIVTGLWRRRSARRSTSGASTTSSSTRPRCPSPRRTGSRC
jgi:alkanesulfonate monooxygenase SsuD/methylene tetrahydromethanopterin reductase-like flavin-dependent oxidoreductase (luciferase family)